jgi:hypothetical protein
MQQSNFSDATYPIVYGIGGRKDAALELRKVQYVFSVMEHGNLSGAAPSLRVSQPTLSRQIHAIRAGIRDRAVHARRRRASRQITHCAQHRRDWRGTLTRRQGRWR